MLVVLHDGGAEFVEPRHFGRGEGAIVDADDCGFGEGVILQVETFAVGGLCRDGLRGVEATLGRC